MMFFVPFFALFFIMFIFCCTHRR